MEYSEHYWNGVDGKYVRPDFKTKKGTVLRIHVKCDRDIEPIDPETFGDFIHSDWGYDIPYGGVVKPYKVLAYEYDKLSFTIEVIVVKKKKEIDELKHFYKGVRDYCFYYDINIENFVVTLITP